MTTEPLPDVWTTRDYPVLLASARLLDTDGPPLLSHQIAAAAGLDHAATVRALINLGHGYLEVRDASTYDGADRYVAGITASGLQAAGQWPSPEAAAERLLAALDEQIDAAVEGTPKASKLRTLRENVGSVSRDVLVDVMGAVLTGRIPT